MKKLSPTHFLAIGALVFAIILFALPSTDAFDRYQEQSLEILESLSENK